MQVFSEQILNKVSDTNEGDDVRRAVEAYMEANQYEKTGGGNKV